MEKYKSGWWRWIIGLTALLGALMEVVDSSIVNVALPHIQATLGVNVAEVSWTITGYALANVIMLPLSAWLGETFGKKKYFIFCLVGFTIASILCGLATTLPLLVTARILQGLAGGGLLAKGQAIMFETFPKEEQGLAVALFGVSVMMGPALGPVLGGYLTDSIGWPWIFFINIPIGIAATLLATICFPKDEKITPPSKTKVDWLGIIFLTIGLGCFQVFLEEGHRKDWFESSFILWMAILSLVGMILFVWQELTTDKPAVELKVLQNKSLAAGSLFSVVLGIGLYGAVFVIPIYAQSIMHYTATQTGILLLPSALCSAVFMFVGSKLNEKLDARIVVLAGSILFCLSLFMLTHLNPNTGGEQFLYPNLIRGAATALMFLPLTMASLSTIPVAQVNEASGFFNLTRQIGGSIGIALISTFLDQRLNYHRSVLVEHISLYEPATRQYLAKLSQVFIKSSPSIAKTKALALLDQIVNKQAAIQSYSDIFWLVALTFSIASILILFLGNGKTSVKIDLH